MNQPPPNSNTPGKSEVPSVNINQSERKQEVPLLPSLSRQPTWVQQFGGSLASRVLWFVCALSVLFLFAWWFTRPTLAEVQKILGNSAEPKEVLETLRNLQRDHFDQFRDLFQIVVLSGLVPIFTLLAGYTFGSREWEKREQEAEE